LDLRPNGEGAYKQSAARARLEGEEAERTRERGTGLGVSITRQPPPRHQRLSLAATAAAGAARDAAYNSRECRRHLPHFSEGHLRREGKARIAQRFSGRLLEQPLYEYPEVRGGTVAGHQRQALRSRIAADMLWFRRMRPVILVVDDEVEVLDVISEMLEERFGYNARSGRDGLVSVPVAGRRFGRSAFATLFGFLEFSLR
jgi:hypothetical protein